MKGIYTRLYRVIKGLHRGLYRVIKDYFGDYIGLSRGSIEIYRV